jgi:hypothetical protein
MRKRVAQRKTKFSDGTVLDYDKEFENDYVEALRATSQENLVNYEARKQQEQAEFNRRNLGKESDYYPNVFGSGTKSSTLGLIKDIESGRVKTPEGMFRRDKDGLFYQEDNTKKGKLRKEAKGLTAAEMAQELMITQYVEELGYSDIFKIKKSQTTSVELPDYLDPMGDRDKDNVPNIIDRPNIPFPAPTRKV